MSILTDIPMAEGRRSDIYEFPNKSFTATQLTLNAPTGPGVKFNDSWLLCVIDWAMDLHSFPFKNDDGTCSSVISNRCARALQSNVLEEYMSSTISYANNACSCPPIEKISECSEQEVKVLRSGGSCGASGKRVFPAR